MSRAQCIVHRGHQVLMAKHRQDGVEWWCLPGGGIKAGETPAQAAIRELREECGVEGTVLRALSYVSFAQGGDAYTYLVDIGDQEIWMGGDPEFGPDEQALVEIRWLALPQIPERDRAFLWAGGLLGVELFYAEVEGWGDATSYPGQPCC
jgi:8-oxo-dGTP diphosphatase